MILCGEVTTEDGIRAMTTGKLLWFHAEGATTESHDFLDLEEGHWVYALIEGGDNWMTPDNETIQGEGYFWYKLKNKLIIPSRISLY